MKLNMIFRKPVDRPIEGVIKADDDASLRLEIEEYVLTKEVEKRLESFLEAYNNYTGANGVWVSGFFGSGKSHLLKILAHLLENRLIEGAFALDLFLPKCGDNGILKADLKRAVQIPSKSILFNIDQKADVISKTQVDALLAVFVKVFDEMCGYYGKHGHIAQFERDLDTNGLYEQFQSAYETAAGKPWKKGREQSLFEGKSIAKAYAKVTGDDEAQTLGILDKYRSQYRVSIEDFAEQVHAFIAQQPPGFRLNFFVDEVGQYIAENVKLMTNLQTIAESLATKCRGQAWVIVTAQEEMDSIVGEMDKRQGNDFSKIQARFNNRMKLTSADVAEVIQMRLLLKNEDGVKHLSEIYHLQRNNFRTLFDFQDGSQTFQNFEDLEHFVHSYPFIPYQFSLFQTAIYSLSKHNAFEGKHSSVGERSMLGVFQHVARKLGCHEIGHLATFDLMFEGIRTALKSNIQRAIFQAENNLNNPFAIRLLKVLFLVKYVKEFRPTIRNICVLLQESFNQDLPALKHKVEEALGVLEKETYIQRDGDYYQYLSDEEKDVEQEIKHTEVDIPEMAAELETIIFNHIIKQRKMRYEENGQDYPFSKKLDGRLNGREYELAIHFYSGLFEHAGNEINHVIALQGMGRNELSVLLPSDDRLREELLKYKQTEKYTLQNISTTQQSAVREILSAKVLQNRSRYSELQTRTQSLIEKARLVVGTIDIEMAATDAQTRISRGFQELITRTYPNLRMLRGATYSEEDISKTLQRMQQGLPGSDATSLSEPEQELLGHIQTSRGGIRTTLKSLTEKFERRPYGWTSAAILCNLASLCARGKVEVRADGNLLESENLARALGNPSGYGNIILDPQVEFTASQIRSLKQFYEDFFASPPRANEARSLAKECGEAFSTLLQELRTHITQTKQYPFLSSLESVVAKLTEVSGKPYSWYLTDLIRQEEPLLNIKESIVDPVLKFMKGPQKSIYDGARQFLQTQEPNFTYLAGNESEHLLKLLKDLDCLRGNNMQIIKQQVDSLQEKVTAQVALEKNLARESIVSLKSRICSMKEFDALTEEQRGQVLQKFEEFKNTIEHEKLIAMIRDTIRRFEEIDYQKLLSQMTHWSQPTPTLNPVKETFQHASPDKISEHNPVATPEPRIEYVANRSIKVSFEKAWLADENDVEEYLHTLRKALLDEIHKGKRIQI